MQQGWTRVLGSHTPHIAYLVFPSKGARYHGLSPNVTLPGSANLYRRVREPTDPTPTDLAVRSKKGGGTRLAISVLSVSWTQHD